MPKPGESTSAPTLQVRGTVDVEKFKAAKTLGGDQVRFELRAMKPVRPGAELAAPSCIICLICIICIVCVAENAEKFNITGLTPLPSGP